MKIIELLNKIANGEEVPKEIIFENYRYYKHPEGYFRSVINSNWIALTTDFDICNILNKEVEVIEEEPRDIEVCGNLFTKSEYDKLAHCEEEKKIPKKLSNYIIREVDKVFLNKINEILDYLEEMR